MHAGFGLGFVSGLVHVRRHPARRFCLGGLAGGAPRVSEVTELARMMEDACANVLCFGHTHYPSQRVVETDVDGSEVDFVLVEYDAEQAVRASKRVLRRTATRITCGALTEEAGARALSARRDRWLCPFQH